MNPYVELGGITAGSMAKYGGGRNGGCGCAGKFLGGAEEFVDNIADYDETANAATMGEIVSKLGGLNEILTSAKTTSGQLAKIGGLRFGGSAAGHAKATEVISDGFRSKFGGCKIGGAESAAEPKSLQAVMDFLKGLNLGQNEELKGVRAVLTKMLANIRFLEGEMNKYAEKLREAVPLKNTESHGVPTAYELYKNAAAELKKQVGMVDNVLDVGLPKVEGDVQKILSNLSDLSAINAQLGSSEYSKKMQGLLTSSVLTVESSKYIEELLKKFGKTIEDYKKMRGLNDLAVLFADAVKGRSLTDEQSRDLLKAINVLTERFGLRDTINPEALALVSGKTGGNVIPDVSMYSGGNTAPLFTGGAGLTYKVPEKTDMTKRIETRKSVRNLLLLAFQRQMTSAYDVVIHALHSLSEKIGSEIPITDHLDTFRANLMRIKSGAIDNRNLYLALIGYFNDVSSKAEKEERIGALNMVISYCESLSAMKEYSASASHFRALADSLRGVIAVIDKYTEEVVAKFGAGEAASQKQLAKMGGSDLADAVSKMSLGRTKPAKTIDDAISKFDYNYRAAQISVNLKAAGQDIKGYGEKYAELTAKSIATILQEERNKYDLAKKILAKFELKGDPNGIYKKDNEKAAAEKFLDETWETKRKFWRTVEALDTYMKAFTDGIVNSPDDIRDIKSMLDEIPVVADIYSSKSGVHLTRVFDAFPANLAAETVSTVISREHDAAYQKRDGEHYYKVLDGKAAVANAPSNPHIVSPPEVGAESKKEASDLLRNLYFLKNLVSVFVHIGSKFGGTELQKKIGLSPLHIYDNLTAYLHCSAYAQGFNTGDDYKKVGDVAADGTLSAFNAEGSAVAISADGKVSASAAKDAGNAAKAAGLGRNTTYGADFIAGVSTDGTEMDYTSALNGQNLFLRCFGVYMRSTMEGLKSIDTGFSWQLEDHYFAILMKAMCAKIFTVLGTYDLFDRPLEFNGLSSIRMILGGSGSMPKVDSACTELYLRLPLLLEFYRNIFGYNTPEGYDNYPNNASADRMYPHKDTSLKIAMMPDVDGVFGGLIKIIFRNARFVVGQNYSDEDISGIISECNAIYQKMSAKHDANNIVRMTVSELVNEINRRYGVISANIRNEYEEDMARGHNYRDFSDKYRSTDSTLDADGAREYSILPDEEGTGSSQQISAAEMLISADLATPASSGNTRFRIGLGHKDLLYRFRGMIDNELREGKESFSFARAIRVAREKLAKAGTDEERFKVIASMVRGKEITNTRDSLSYLLFHETVVTGLNTLSAIHTLLARFKRRATLIDIGGLEDEFWAYCRTRGAGGAQQISADPASPRSFIHWLIHRTLAVADTNQSGIIGSLFDAPEEAFAHINRLIHNFTAAGGAVDLANAGVFVNAGATPAFTGVANGNLMNILVSINKALEDYPKIYKSANLTNEKKQLQAFFHGLFDPQFVMRELVESVFGLGADLQGLVEVKINDNRLSISLTGLKNTVDELFQSVNHYLELLRPVVSEEFLAPYVNKMTPGSYYWLQEQINEKIFAGRDIIKLGDGQNYKYVPLDRLIQKLDYTWNWLTQKYGFDTVLGGGGGNFVVVNNLGAADRQFQFGNLFAELVYYDASKPHSGICPSGEANTQAAAPSLVAATSDPYESLHFAGPQGQKVMDTRFAARFKQLYSFGEEYTFNRSVMFSFNQLVAKFIRQFYDPSTQKIYQGLISPLVNGPLSQACMDHLYTYPDITPLMFSKGTKSETTRFPSSMAIKALLTAGQNANAAATKKLLTTYLNIINDGNAETFALSYNNNSVAFGQLGVAQDTRLINLQVRLMVLVMAMIAKRLVDWLRDVGGAGAVAATQWGSATAFGAITHPTGAKQALIRGNVGIIDLLDAFFGRRMGAVQITALINSDVVDAQIDAIAPNNALKEYYNTFNAAATTRAIYQNIAAVGAVANRGRFGNTANIDYSAGFFDAANAGQEVLDAINVINNVLIMPAEAITGMILANEPDFSDAAHSYEAASIIKRAVQVVPLAAKIPNGQSEEVLDLLSLVIGGMSEAALTAAGVTAAEVKAFNSRFNELTSQIRVIPQTYIPGRSLEPQLQVKYEDFLQAQGSNIFDSPPYTDGATYVLAASSDRGRGILADDSLSRVAGKSSSVPFATTTTLRDIQLFGQRADPDYQHVLFTSIATILKNLVSSRAANQNLVYVLDNIADITLYMKERMRANLPGFKVLFNELINRAEFLKHLSRESSSLNLGRDAVPAAAAQINPWPFVLQPIANANEAVRTRQHGILDTVIRAAASMVSACDKVLTEIGDEPRFMEIYQNSIKDYRNRYSVDPFMPISHITKVYSNIREKANVKGTCGYTEFLPFCAPGSDEMKYLYGTRGIFGYFEKKPSLEQAPGFVSSIEMGALGLTSGTADKKRMETFYSALVRAARYVFECRHLKGNLTTYNMHPPGANPASLLPSMIAQEYAGGRKLQLYSTGSYVKDDMIINANQQNTDTARVAANRGVPFSDAGKVNVNNRSAMTIISQEGLTEIGVVKFGAEDSAYPPAAAFSQTFSEVPKAAYAITHNSNEVIQMVESSFRDERIKELVKYTAGNKSSDQNLPLQNIIDLNIVPINVHALMREIPLANLYNYSYSFDRMIIELYYGLKNKNAIELMRQLYAQGTGGKDEKFSGITSAKDMLVALLLDPYRNIWSTGEFESFAKGMLVGATAVDGLNRPKFLSDQIYGSAIFGEMYSDPAAYSEIGPSSENSVSVLQLPKEDKIKELIIKMVSAILASIVAGGVGQRFGPLFAGNAGNFEASDMVKKPVEAVMRRPNMHASDLAEVVRGILATKAVAGAAGAVGDGATAAEWVNLNAVGFLGAAPAAGGLPVAQGRGKFTLATLVVGTYVRIVSYGVMSIVNELMVNGNKLTPAIGHLIDNMIFSTAIPNHMFGAAGAFAGYANEATALGIMYQTYHINANPDYAAAFAANALQFAGNMWNGAASAIAALGVSATKAAYIMSIQTKRNWLDPLMKLLVNDRMGVPAGAVAVDDGGLGANARGRGAKKLNSVNQAAILPDIAIHRGLIDGFFNLTAADREKTSRRRRDVPSKRDIVPITKLHYLKTPAGNFDERIQPDNENVLDSDQVGIVAVDAALRPILAMLSKIRFDTVFVRNLIFIINLYRSVRLKLSRDLTYNREIIQSSAAITKDSLTEYFGNQIWSPRNSEDWRKEREERYKY